MLRLSEAAPPATPDRTVFQLGIALTLLFLIGGSYLSFRHVQAVQQNERWVNHTDSVLLELEVVLRGVSETESAYRGYVFTEDSTFMPQVRQAEAEARASTARTRWLMRDNPVELTLFDSMAAVIDAKLRWMDEGVGLMRSGRSPRVVRLASKGYGRRLMERIHALAHVIQQNEVALRSARQEATARSFAAMLLTIVATAGVGGVLLFIIVLQSRRSLAVHARNAREQFQQRELLRTTLASIGDALILTDANGAVTYLNSVAQHMTGWSTAEAAGKPLDEVFIILNESTRKPVSNPAMRALRTGTIVGLANHTILIARDGTEVHIDDSAAPIKTENGEVIGCVLIFRDISEQRAAENAAMQLAAIVASSDDAIISKNLQGVIQTWNQGAHKLFGYTAQEAVGQPATLIIPEDRQTEERDILDRIARGLTIDHLQTLRKRKDGTVVDVSLTISPIRDQEGEITGASTIARDITERRRAQDKINYSEQRMRYALAAARMGSFTYYPEEDRSDADAQMLALFGLPPGSPLTLKMAMDSLIDPKDRQRYHDAVERALDPAGDGLLHQEIHVIHPDGAERDLMISAQVIFHGDPPAGERMLGVALDVTDRKRMEDVLRQNAADLAETDRRKNEFLAMLAHELRNPLAPIRNTIEILRTPTMPAPERETALAMMDRQTDQLVRMVDDLLDISRVSQGKIVLRESVVDIAAVVRHAAESAKQGAMDAEQVLDVQGTDTPLYVKGDEARLKQVLDNLLNNAIKFTPHGGHIRLTAERRNGEAVLTVRDNGIGISERDLRRVFDLFAQADPTLHRANGGLGIGLTLVKNLVELQGGSVAAHSAGEGKGSTFTVRLPVTEAPRHAPPARKGPSAAAVRRKVLVVDDNRDAAESLGMILTRTGHDVRIAYDGLEGLATAGTFLPDVVLLDIGLPNLNGYEVARRIRRHPWGQGIYLVALTGWGQDEDRTKSRDAGFDLHLVKPVELAELRSLLAGPLERAAAGSNLS